MEILSIQYFIINIYFKNISELVKLCILMYYKNTLNENCNK